MKITFTLVDQDLDPAARQNIDYVIKPNPNQDNKAFLGRPRAERNPCFGAPKFVSLDTLGTNDYLANDSLFIKISICLDELSAI
ncbi:unnamed protein product [Protopolystoma xenopodis]|uniref:MATH domain-containing protein n=1 Tax=Protopolystoma xenopodis TaxID=117903 RepID=A0A448XL63_9PLAT|nr:unnamed protein product [Protopolystoma xenopodis]